MQQELPGRTPCLLLCGRSVGDTDALFDIVHQAGTTLVGCKVPDQDPAKQYEYRHDPDKCRYFFVCLESCYTCPVGGIGTIKKSNDLEERTIENFYPSGIRFLHVMSYGCWSTIRPRSGRTFYLWRFVFDRKAGTSGESQSGDCGCRKRTGIISTAGPLPVKTSPPRS